MGATSQGALAGVTGPMFHVIEKGVPATINDIDTVVDAEWHRPVTELHFALKHRDVPVERIGDAIASRTMMEAVHEGERAARRVRATA